MLGFAKRLLGELQETFDEGLMHEFMAKYADGLQDPVEASQVFFTLYNEMVESEPAEAYIFL